MPEAVVFKGQPERLRRVARIGDGPQVVPGRGWAGAGPVAFRILDRSPVADRPQLLHGESPGPTGADRPLGALSVEIPVIVDPQTERLQVVSVGVALAGDF